MLIELGQRGFGGSLRSNRRAHPAVAGFSAFLIGCLVGGLANWLLPSRLFPPGPWPGASLVVTPILNGLLMHWYGVWREGRGHPDFFVTTFWGGALFAFGLSLVRFASIN